MKKEELVKYTEDLLNEDEFDVEALRKSKWKHPISVWFNYNFFLVQVFIIEIIVDIMFNLKQFINKWKK